MQLWLICFMTVFLAEAYGDSEFEPQDRQDTFPFDDEKSADVLDLMLRHHKAGGRAKSCQAKLNALDAKLDHIITLIPDKDCCCNNQGEAATSCKEIYDEDPSSESKAYRLEVGSGATVQVYCHMTELAGCGGGGWTLVMKTNGSKNTFEYFSSLWDNKEAFNLVGGQTGFDLQETKLPTYWNTPFTKICLGMKIDQQIKFIVIDEEANSLHSLIADGEYRKTSVGRDTWESLIAFSGSLQKNCNKEGFNVKCSKSPSSKARIGILANNENDCSNCDSRIGFGTSGSPDSRNTCGNAVKWNPDISQRSTPAMGYIFVQ